MAIFLRHSKLFSQFHLEHYYKAYSYKKKSVYYRLDLVVRCETENCLSDIKNSHEIPVARTDFN